MVAVERTSSENVDRTPSAQDRPPQDAGASLAQEVQAVEPAAVRNEASRIATNDELADSFDVSAATPSHPEAQVVAQAGRDPNWGLCPDHQRGSGPQRAFQDHVTQQYLNQDWDGVEQSLGGLANAAGFTGKPVASVMLSNFLRSGGDMNLDYTVFAGDLPTVWGRQSAWISESKNTVEVTDRLDASAAAEIRRRVANGETSGVVRRSGHVVTNAQEDNDLYYALGKFQLDAEYRFDVNRGFLGLQGERTTVRRSYTATDRYDWDPPRRCGLVDHVIPDALERQGRAASFNVEVKWNNGNVELR